MKEDNLPVIYNSNILKMAIDKWGKTAQVDMAIEEMSELIKALCKDKRQSENKEITDNIKEEIADVLIMLYQMIEIFGGKEEIEECIKFKTNRLKERLNDC